MDGTIETLVPSPIIERTEGPPSSQQPSQLPVQGELCYLPGRLRINPSLWDTEDVAYWLHWAQREYSLRWAAKRCFEMNGRALCLLTKEDFRRRCPNSGDVLYEILQYVKRHRTDGLRKPTSQSSHTPQQQRPLIQQDPNAPVQRPQYCATDANTVPGNTEAPPISVTTFPGRQDPVKPARENSPLHTHLSQQTHSGALADASSTPLSKRASKANTGEEPLNLSHREQQRSAPREGHIPECKLLWDYVYQLLCDPHYQAYIRWEDRKRLVFKVVDPNGLARLWGNHKSRDNMTYEKMSRALRHYYKLNIIRKEPKQKLLFRFLKTPQQIRVQKSEPVSAESPAQTPPQDDDAAQGQSPFCDRDTPEHSPPREFSGDKVSPGSVPPQLVASQ